MNTHIPKKEEIKENWHLIDAKGVEVGKVAVLAANIIRGKNKADFTPHLDMGDYVVIINAKHVKIRGGKLDKKSYYRHSWYPGGLKTETMRRKMEKSPESIIEHAVYGMLPKNRLTGEYMKKLKVYPEEGHKHEAQKPKKIEVKGK